MNKLLIVDDNEIDLKIYSHFLQAHGYEVHTASDGLQGYSKYKEVSPDLVITDIIMHNNGLELLDKIKKDNADLPVFTMSAGVGADQGDALLDVSAQIGADYNFHKPISPSNLVEKVNAYFTAECV